MFDVMFLQAAFDAIGLLALAITAVTGVVVAFATEGVKRALPIFPRFLVPILALGLSLAADYVLTYAAGVTNPLGVAGLALAAAVLKAAYDVFTGAKSARGGSPN